MNTKFRNLGIALFLAVATIGANATELRSAIEIEPAMEFENWMTNEKLFDAVRDDAKSGTVVDIAVSNSDFSILVEAVTKADLAGALSADGPFTVFAPTNEAFENLFHQLGVSGVKDLTAEQLAPILTYHVVPGKIMSADLSNTSVVTLNGAKIKIDLTEGVMINDSKVTTADISGENGVIHVIDKVLLPEAKATKSSGCSN